VSGRAENSLGFAFAEDPSEGDEGLNEESASKLRRPHPSLLLLFGILVLCPIVFMCKLLVLVDQNAKITRSRSRLLARCESCCRQVPTKYSNDEPPMTERF
jgi:hypothetical protein